MQSDWQFPYLNSIWAGGNMRCLLMTLSIMGLALAGCVSRPPPVPVSSTEGTTWVQKGHVTDVRDVTENGGENSVIGSAVGALVGSIVGNNIGAGTGRTLSTIGGAAAGGVTGQAIGRSSSNRISTKLTVQSESGDINVYYAEPSEAFRIGDEVKIVSNNGKVKITH